MQFRLGYFVPSLCPARACNGRRLRRRRGLSRTINAISLGRLGRDVFCPRIAIGPGALPPPRPGFFYAFQFWAPLATSCGPLLAPRVQQSLYFQGAQTGHRCQKRDLGLEVPAHRRNRRQRIYGWMVVKHTPGAEGACAPPLHPHTHPSTRIATKELVKTKILPPFSLISTRMGGDGGGPRGPHPCEASVYVS